MSLLHAILFKVLMKTRKDYFSDKIKDYATIRKQEDTASARVKIPKNVVLSQRELAGVSTEWIVEKVNPTDRIVLYIHGGGFVTGSSVSRRSFTCYIADKIGLNVVSVNYRLAPEHPFLCSDLAVKARLVSDICIIDGIVVYCDCC